MSVLEELGQENTIFHSKVAHQLALECSGSFFFFKSDHM